VYESGVCWMISCDSRKEMIGQEQKTETAENGDHEGIEWDALLSRVQVKRRERQNGYRR
jgi:hypothetical protein